MSAYPGALAVFAGFTATHTLAADNHAAQHNLEQAEILAVQTKVGTGSSTSTSGTVLRGTGAGTSSWGQVALTTDVTGTLPVTSGGIGQTSLTALPLVSPTITGGGSWAGSPTITTPTIASFVNSIHDHNTTAAGGQLNNGSIDWSTFSNNMKSATNSGSISVANTDADLVSNGLGVTFTVATACNALVTVSLGMSSTTDYEFRPEIRLDTSVFFTLTPAAAAGTAGGRANVRGFTYVVPLTAGTHTLSAGVFASASTSGTIAAGGGTIAAFVLGKVTA